MSENSEDCEYETIFFDILEFLKEYEKFPCLWDRNHDQFKDRRERLKCEVILGEKLGIRDLRTLRRKIRSVRGTYNTEIRKLKYCIENNNTVYPPKLFWFPTADKFLRVTTDLPYQIYPSIPLGIEQKRIAKKQPIDKLLSKKRARLLMVSNPKKLQRRKENQEYIENIVQEVNDDETIESFEDYEELESLGDQMEQKSQDGDMSVKFETLDEFDENESIDNESASSISKVNTTSNRQDLGDIVSYLKDIASDNEFLAFGRSVGVQLKNMPLDLAVQLQMDIQSHISKTRLEYLQRAQKQMES